MAQSKFQVIRTVPRSGIAKGGKPYALLVVEGVFTDADGVMQVGELVFFADRESGKLPSFQVGKTYEPITRTYVNQEKKLVAGVYELRAVAEMKAAA